MNHFLSTSIFILCLTLVQLTTQLHSYVSVPRSNADTTARMNAGGDPPQRPGLKDNQRSPEYIDDWWGRNDYYYSKYGVQYSHTLKNPTYNTDSPPYYPWPNTYYNNTQNVQYKDINTREYRPNSPQ